MAKNFLKSLSLISFTFIPALSYADKWTAAEKANHPANQSYVAEIDGFGGSLTPDRSGNTWAAGARAMFFITPTFELGAEYVYSTLFIDPSSSFGQIRKSNAQNIIDGQFAINFPILFGIGDTKLPMALFMTLGTGAVNINDTWRWLGVIGGGLKIYTPLEWLALRLDVNTYLHTTPTVVGNKFGYDVALLAGFAAFLPY